MISTKTVTISCNSLVSINRDSYYVNSLSSLDSLASALGEGWATTYSKFTLYDYTSDVSMPVLYHTSGCLGIVFMRERRASYPRYCYVLNLKTTKHIGSLNIMDGISHSDTSSFYIVLSKLNAYTTLFRITTVSHTGQYNTTGDNIITSFYSNRTNSNCIGIINYLYVSRFQERPIDTDRVKCTFYNFVVGELETFYSIMDWLSGSSGQTRIPKRLCNSFLAGFLEDNKSTYLKSNNIYAPATYNELTAKAASPPSKTSFDIKTLTYGDNYKIYLVYCSFTYNNSAPIFIKA